jgi:16S rRNA (uracil1498-N3)-methyltransferase
VDVHDHGARMFFEQCPTQMRNHEEYKNSMRRRFFVDEVRSGRAEISGDDARHLTRVLRVEAGQRYEISDNRNVYLAEIEIARKEHVTFRTIEKLAGPAPTVRLVLCAALIKFDHFEWMIEKATELGVSEIVPVETIRSERGLERAAHKRIERWRRIALEASQQSRRAVLPEVSEPEPLRVTLMREATRKFALDENPATPPLNTALPAVRDPQDSVALLIGPEGGWTEEERAHFTAAAWMPVSLGPLILRAETAALATLAIVNSAW